MSRSRRVNPASADRAASSSIAGQGRSGLTWSAVTGDTPPQSSMPARSMSANSSPTRFGGACSRIFGPSTSLAVAIVAARSSRSASGSFAIAVSGFARKFWTIVSWTCPCARAAARIANSDSARSTRVSPIPMRMPVVNGTPTRPASVSVRSRTAGSLSGLPKCGPPGSLHSRVAVVSSIIPMLGATGLSRVSSSQLRTPGLRCGSRPVSSSTAIAHARTYSSVEW